MTDQMRMVNLLGEWEIGSFQGREGTAFQWVNGIPPRTIVGSVTVLGSVGGGIIADPGMFELGRNTVFFCNRTISGAVKLQMLPKAYRRSLLDVKVHADMLGDLTLIEGGTGHGQLEITVNHRVDCSVIIQTKNEFGWQNVKVVIDGSSTLSVSVTGIPHQITKQEDGTLHILLDAGLKPEYLEEVTTARREGRLNDEIAAELARWEREGGTLR